MYHKSDSTSSTSSDAHDVIHLISSMFSNKALTARWTWILDIVDSKHICILESK